MKKQLATLLLATAATGLLADDPKHAFEAQASAVIASADTTRMVDGGNLNGMSFGLAYRGKLGDGLHHRAFVDLTGLKGRIETGLSGAAPKHLSFGWDIIQDVDKWSLYGGLFGFRWKQTVDDQTSSNYRDLSVTGTSNTNNTPKGTKLGVRIGAERALTRDLAFRMDFTQTEFNKKLNPSWFRLGLIYKFGRM